MPEGDTIFRAARTLDRALSEKTVLSFETVLPHLARVHVNAPIVGRVIQRVCAEGKWLSIHFSGFCWIPSVTLLLLPPLPFLITCPIAIFALLRAFCRAFVASVSIAKDRRHRN